MARSSLRQFVLLSELMCTCSCTHENKVIKGKYTIERVSNVYVYGECCVVLELIFSNI